MKTQTVPAIEHGTVIDHIVPEKTLEIARLLGLDGVATIALNLPSSQMKTKGVIKVYDQELTPEQTDHIALLSPDATISIIQNFKVVSKRQVLPPDTVIGLLSCSNPNCITHQEPIESHFHCRQRGDKVELRCFYCEKTS